MLCRTEERHRTSVREALTWERLDHRRASRIASYRKGSIDEPETWGEIKAWAVDRLLKLKMVFGPRISDLAREKM